MPSASSARAARSTANPLAMPDRSARRSARALATVPAAASTVMPRQPTRAASAAASAAPTTRCALPGPNPQASTSGATVMSNAPSGRSAHLPRQREYGERVVGQRERRAGGVPVEPRQLGIGQVRRHLRNDRVEGAGDGVASGGRGRRRQPRPGDLGRERRAHRRPAELERGATAAPRRSPQPATSAAAPSAWSTVRRRGESSVSMSMLLRGCPIIADAPRRAPPLRNALRRARSSAAPCRRSTRVRAPCGPSITSR